VLASLINVNRLEFDTKIQIAASSLSIGMLVIVVIAIAAIWRGIRTDSSKVASLKEDLRVSGKYWPLYDLIRQFLTLSLLTFGRNL
jgi:hypothetical protein